MAALAPEALPTDRAATMMPSMHRTAVRRGHDDARQAIHDARSVVAADPRRSRPLRHRARAADSAADRQATGRSAVQACMVMPSSFAAVPCRIAILSASLSVGVDSTWSTAVLVHGYGES